MATNPLTPRVNNIETGGTWKIGDVKQSFLTEVEFQAEHDDTWVLCDGRDVIGSDYAVLKEGDAVTSHNIPDARGQFLRGLDTSGTVDPDGAGRVIGDSQVDDFKEHDHTMRYVATYDLRATGGTDMYGTNISSFNKDNPETDLRGGAETRPKNVAVNMFIKINREPSS
jgi:hypothetical protein